MKAEQTTRPQDQESSAAEAGGAMPVLLSVPVWDITDEQIEEWKHAHSGVAGMCLAGYTAAAIRDGEYDNGRGLPTTRRPAGRWCEPSGRPSPRSRGRQAE